jgi:hypothetical protein
MNLVKPWWWALPTLQMNLLTPRDIEIRLLGHLIN